MNAMLETPELPAVFDGVKLAAVAAVLYVIVRCLNLKSPTAPPDLYFQDSGLSRFLLKSCPLLTKEYIPPLIWGKSGHIQTALYGKMGRVRSPHPYGHRKFITMSDGATSTFDLFEPLAEHCVGGELNLTLLPTGCTWEFGAMVNYIKKTYPLTQLVVVGFSLGGNIVCKYLGETQANQEKVLCCVSVCQGYSALRAQETFMQWDQCRRFYNFLMADNMKKIILSHRQALFGDHVKKPQSLEDTDLSRLYTATSLMQIDDNVMRKFHGYNSLKEYYEEESCMRYLHRIYVPLMLVNAADDPLVHESLLTIPKSLSEKRENVMFVLPLHGGHLGFFEGSVLFPEPLTWMDKLVVEYANAICQWERNKSQCSDTEQVEADLE
ncbi:PREDICTED: monoacylglycerol lipase ABHD2 [Rhinopithecus bieti]|uniref:monoacylglycerol lipase ABHD2 n=1 Tax=Rhinopithecus bieti TaxID=61621 RepID=UPI00083BB7B9|nr:PREDICTED: monoacylglycerol lipase ABHD2 [Rhinopithecus bieti]